MDTEIRVNLNKADYSKYTRESCSENRVLVIALYMYLSSTQHSHAYYSQQSYTFLSSFNRL